MEDRAKYRAVLFDLDDTLLETATIKWAQHKAVAKEFYGIDLTDEVLREHWGKPFDLLITYLYQNSDTVENMRTANRSTEARFPKQIHEDTLEVIDRLTAAGILMGVVTSINMEFAKHDLELAGIPTDTFIFIQGADDTPYHKPDGRVFDPALKRLAQESIAKEQTVYIGDALIDYHAAREVGLDFIGVATGFVALTEFRTEGAIAVPRLKDVPDLALAGYSPLNK